jgi:hypothetical protein
MGNFQFQNHDRDDDGDHAVTKRFESAFSHDESLSKQRQKANAATDSET